MKWRFRTLEIRFGFDKVEPFLTFAPFSLPSAHILVLLCGLPASGKTSFAKRLEQRHDKLHEALCGEFGTTFDSKRPFQVSCVHFDDHLRASVAKNGHEFSPEVWKLSREEALREIENRLDSPSSSATAKDSLLPSPRSVIIVDDNMNYTSMRKQIFDIAYQRTYNSNPVELTFFLISVLSLLTSQ